MRIPKIHTAVLDTIYRESLEPDWIERMLNHIEKENPGYNDLLVRIYDRDDTAIAAASIAATIIAYRMIETQLEINELEEQFSENP